MAYIGNQPAESFTSFATQEFSTSATTSYTLNHAVTNENEIALFVNNVRQQPGSGKAYTATGTALTLSAATASTDTMYCVFLGRALQTVTPATNSITAAMVGNDLISGKDALTVPPATTDELLLSDAGTLKRIDVAHFGNAPAFYAFSSNGQTPSDNTNTLIELDSEDFDTDSAFTNTASNYKFTVPANCAGKYFFAGTILIDSQENNGVYQAAARIYKNGSNVAETYANMSSNFPRDIPMHVTVTLSLSAGDYIQLYGLLDDASGSGLDFKGNSSIRQSSLLGFRLIGV